MSCASFLANRKTNTVNVCVYAFFSVARDSFNEAIQISVNALLFYPAIQFARASWMSPANWNRSASKTIRWLSCDWACMCLDEWNRSVREWCGAVDQNGVIFQIKPKFYFLFDALHSSTSSFVMDFYVMIEPKWAWKIEIREGTKKNRL